MNQLIKGGRLVTAETSYDADLLISDGRIAAIGTALKTEPGSQVIDATGLLVLPGAIDAHTHLEMKMGNTFSADSYESGTMAAACGGVTMVIDYTLQNLGGSILSMIQEREELCSPAACVDYSFHGGISDVTEQTLEEMQKVVDYGVPSIKAYMVYDFGLEDADLLRVLRRSKEVGALITVHAENRGIINANIHDFQKRGTLDAWHHYLSRPEYAELEADYRAILLAQYANAPIYIVHLANAGGVALVQEARENGFPVFAETCPQYLHFTSEVYQRPDGVRFLCSPSIKGVESKEALWEGIRTGVISTVATDHCPSYSFEKEWGSMDFTKAPNGCMGIENMYPYLLSAANQGKLSFEQVVKVCATNVAQIFGCAKKKGSLIPGTDADIVLYDPTKEFIVSKSNMHSKVDYTIWEGVKLKGYPVRTIVRGKTVYLDGNFVGRPGLGEFVRRSPWKMKIGKGDF